MVALISRINGLGQISICGSVVTERALDVSKSANGWSLKLNRVTRIGLSVGRHHCHAVVLHHDSRQHFHHIVLAALRGEFGLAGLALIHVALNFGQREFNARRAAIHNTAQRWTMAFAPCGHAEQGPKTIMRHEFGLPKSCPVLFVLTL